MRCKCCDVVLLDMELSKKDSNGEFLDTCNRCLVAGQYGVIYNEGEVVGFQWPDSMTDPKGSLSEVYGIVGEIFENGGIKLDN